jgi:aminoglycoside phosphotransferase
MQSKWDPARILATSLSASQARLALSVFPPGSTILRAHYFDNYDLPCPINVTIAEPGGAVRSVVLRTARKGSIELEAELLALLDRAGLPVPKVLAGPATTDDQPANALITSVLLGRDLQSLAMLPGANLVEIMDVLAAGIHVLASATTAVQASPVADRLPRHTLHEQLALGIDSHWLEHPAYSNAVDRLDSELARITTPLVFSNGDYQPGNFLADDGQLTGVLDFESAAFQDPLFGLAKYPIYDLSPLNAAGFVDHYLRVSGFSKQDFLPRLALGCVLTLARQIPVEGGSAADQAYRRHVLTLLDASLP